MTPSREVGDLVRRDVPLAPFTTWRVGGAAEEFADVEDVESARAALLRFRSERVAVLGAGSNVLVDDRLPEVGVLRIHAGKGSVHLEPAEGVVVVEAGVPMPRLARHVARRGLTGLEFLGGIPGTVGGGVIMNAGIGGPEGPCMADVVEWVEVLSRDGSLSRHAGDGITWSYRRCSLGPQGVLVVRAALRVRSDEAVDPLAVIAGNLKSRRDRQPIGQRSAGSVFLPADGVAAGAWIEKAGLKGYQVGGARISSKHANWIEADDRATSSDIRIVIDHVQETVKARFGVELAREVQYFPSEAVALAGNGAASGDGLGSCGRDGSDEEGLGR